MIKYENYSIHIKAFFIVYHHYRYAVGSFKLAKSELLKIVVEAKSIGRYTLTINMIPAQPKHTTKITTRVLALRKNARKLFYDKNLLYSVRAPKSQSRFYYC